MSSWTAPVTYSMTENYPQVRCYDYQGKVQDHEALELGQRYMSPTTGKCKHLVVQGRNPHAGDGTVPIRDCAPRIRQLAALLATHPPIDDKGLKVWLKDWPWFMLLNFWPFGRHMWKQTY